MLSGCLQRAHRSFASLPSYMVAAYIGNVVGISDESCLLILFVPGRLHILLCYCDVCECGGKYHNKYRQTSIPFYLFIKTTGW